MVLLTLWAFIAYGFTSILVWGSIFESTRLFIKSKSKFFGDLISCTLCPLVVEVGKGANWLDAH